MLNIRNLQCYLKHGLVLKKIYRVISFDQKDFIRPYIEKNTKLRAESNIKFENEFFKLMNNSVFGKTMENVRKRGNFELVHSAQRI